MHSDAPAEAKARAIRIHDRAQEFFLSAALFAAAWAFVIFIADPILRGKDIMALELIRAFFLYGTPAVAAGSLLIGLILLLWSRRLSRSSLPS